MKHILLYFSLLLTGLLSGVAGKGQNREAELVRSIRNTLDSSYTNFGYDIRKQNRISQVFDSLFDVLASRLRANPAPPATESTMDGKILSIAAYKAVHNDLFTEISNKYIYGVDNKDHIAPASPLLEAVHATPAYRLVWEYFMLKPPAARMVNKYDIRTAQAIAKINSPASLLTLEKQYEYSTKTKIALDPSIILKQKLGLTTVGKMPSEAALKTLLTMINRPVQRDTTGKLNWQPKEFAKGMFSGKEKLKTEGQWKAVGQSLGRKQTDAATKRQLRELKLID